MPPCIQLGEYGEDFVIQKKTKIILKDSTAKSYESDKLNTITQNIKDAERLVRKISYLLKHVTRDSTRLPIKKYITSIALMVAEFGGCIYEIHNVEKNEIVYTFTFEDDGISRQFDFKFDVEFISNFSDIEKSINAEIKNMSEVHKEFITAIWEDRTLHYPSNNTRNYLHSRFRWNGSFLYNQGSPRDHFSLPRVFDTLKQDQHELNCKRDILSYLYHNSSDVCKKIGTREFSLRSPKDTNKWGKNNADTIILAYNLIEKALLGKMAYAKHSITGMNAQLSNYLKTPNCIIREIYIIINEVVTALKLNDAAQLVVEYL